MSWTWRLEAADGTQLSGATAPASPAHASQSEAESWLGEFWRELSAEGVAQASLFSDGERVYGPMALTE